MKNKYNLIRICEATDKKVTVKAKQLGITKTKLVEYILEDFLSSRDIKILIDKKENK